LKWWKEGKGLKVWKVMVDDEKRQPKSDPQKQTISSLPSLLFSDPKRRLNLLRKQAAQRERDQDGRGAEERGEERRRTFIAAELNRDFFLLHSSCWLLEDEGSVLS